WRAVMGEAKVRHGGCRARRQGVGVHGSGRENLNRVRRYWSVRCFRFGRTQPFIMHLLKNSSLLLALVAVFAGAARLSADVVETKNGARIVGKVTKIADATVLVETDFAGNIAIKQ